MCGDPFYNYDTKDGVKKETPKTLEFLTDCPKQGPLPPFNGCTKITGGDIVVRGCGYSGNEENKCGNDWKIALAGASSCIFCDDGDGCNRSNTINISMISVFVTTILAIMFK